MPTEQGLSNTELELALKSLIQQIRAAATTLDALVAQGRYMTIEDRCDLSTFVHENLNSPIADFSHVMLTDIRSYIAWAAKRKAGGY